MLTVSDVDVMRASGLSRLEKHSYSLLPPLVLVFIKSIMATGPYFMSFHYSR